MSDAHTTHFITIDLDLESATDLTPLVEAFGEDVFPLRNDAEGNSYVASVNLTTGEESADALLRGYIALVEALSPEARAMWDGCTRRVFDLGFQAGTEPFSTRDLISADTVGGLAMIGGTLAITIYSYTPEAF